SFDSMTVAATHETAEAITDPDGTTWFDRSGNENGDVVNGSTVYLNGYAVQREGSIPASLSNFLPMTPTGSVAGHGVSFSIVSYVMLTNCNLGEYVDPNYSTRFYGYGVNPGSHFGTIASNVTTILTAGTDQVGVNAVEYTATAHGKTSTYEWRDVTGQASTTT